MTATEDNIVINSEVTRGLCVTCNNAPFCVFRLRNKGRVVWYCELFNDYVPVAEDKFKTKTTVESKTEKKEETKFKGLCVNCQNRNTCTYPKPESGIWHCEDYC